MVPCFTGRPSQLGRFIAGFTTYHSSDWVFLGIGLVMVFPSRVHHSIAWLHTWFSQHVSAVHGSIIGLLVLDTIKKVHYIYIFIYIYIMYVFI